MSYKIQMAEVVNGALYPYLKGIELVGRVNEGIFRVYGCEKENEKKFYKGILDYDKTVGVNGFKTVEDVEKFWLAAGGVILVVDEGEYKIIGTHWLTPVLGEVAKG